MNQLADEQSTVDSTDLFRELANEYCSYVQSTGIDFAAYRDTSVPVFGAQSPARQAHILACLRASVNICRNTRAQQKSFEDTPALLWWALKELKLRPTSDLFGHIDRNSVIEVHTAEGVQIFRNFNFYRYCSYTLEELYCYPWNYLYEREESITSMIMHFAGKIFVGEVLTTVPVHIPAHIVHERFSLKRNNIDLKIRWVSPLYGESNTLPVATIVVETAELAKRVDLFDPLRLGGAFDRVHAEPALDPQ